MSYSNGGKHKAGLGTAIVKSTVIGLVLIVASFVLKVDALLLFGALMVTPAALAITIMFTSAFCRSLFNRKAA